MFQSFRYELTMLTQCTHLGGSIIFKTLQKHRSSVAITGIASCKSFKYISKASFDSKGCVLRPAFFTLEDAFFTSDGDSLGNRSTVSFNDKIPVFLHNSRIRFCKFDQFSFSVIKICSDRWYHRADTRHHRRPCSLASASAVSRQPHLHRLRALRHSGMLQYELYGYACAP